MMSLLTHYHNLEEIEMNMLLAAQGGGMGVMVVWIVAMVGLIYFMMIRPQRKEQKRVNEMLGSMEVGDSVVTTSGFYGVLLDITDEDVIVEFGNNKNCRIPMRKAAIAQVEKAVTAQPVPAAKAEEKKAEEKAEDSEA